VSRDVPEVREPQLHRDVSPDTTLSRYSGQCVSVSQRAVLNFGVFWKMLFAYDHLVDRVTMPTASSVSVKPAQCVHLYNRTGSCVLFERTQNSCLRTWTPTFQSVVTRHTLRCSASACDACSTVKLEGCVLLYDPVTLPPRENPPPHSSRGLCDWVNLGVGLDASVMEETSVLTGS
jgi:hypothetical protein